MLRRVSMRAAYLDRNENRYGPAPACFEALRRIDPETFFRYSRDFEQGFTNALSKRLAQLHGVPEDRIAQGCGAEDLLRQAVRHIVQPGDRCLVPDASWWYYRRVADEIGGVTAYYPLVESGSAYAYDPDAIDRALRAAPAPVVLIASPNNPTGNRFPVSELPRLLESHSATIFVYDEAYWGFSETPDDAVALTRRHANLLVLRTFSKLHALAGARIGYAIAGAGLDGFLRGCHRQLGHNRISEQLALAALSSPEYHDRIRANMIRDRTALLEALRERPDVEAYDSEANFVLARFPEGLLAPLRAALERHGLFVKYFDEAAFESCVRMTIGTSDDTARLLAVLRKVLGTVQAAPALEPD